MTNSSQAEQTDLCKPELFEALQRSIMSYTYYCGVPAYKNPMDAWMYQQIIYETRPDFVIEIGNMYGGGLLYLADICASMNKQAHVIGFDVDHAPLHAKVVHHPGIKKLYTGKPIDTISQFVRDYGAIVDANFLVIEDSAHTYDTTLLHLRLFAPYLKSGNYFVVEDTIINHGLSRIAYGKKSAYEAAQDYVASNPDFYIDRSCEKFVVTHNPSGYIRRS